MKNLILFSFAMEQIKKNKLTYVFLCLEILIGFFYFYFISLYVSSYSSEYRFLKEFKTQDMLYVSFFNKDDLLLGINQSEIENHPIYQKIANNPDIELDGYFSDALYTQNENYKVNCNIYKNIITQNAVYDLKEGKQLYEYNGATDVIPAIVSEGSALLKNHNLNDIVTLVDYTVINHGEGKLETVEEQFDIVIWGIIKRPYRYFVSTSSETPQIASDMVYNDYYYNKEEEHIIIPDFKMKDGSEFSDSCFFRSCFFAKIKYAPSSSEYKKIYADLKKDFDILEHKDLVKMSFANYTEGFGDRITITIIFLILCIAGMGGVNAFLMDKQKQTFAIYYLTGAKWTDCLLIDLIRNLIVIAVPSILGVGFVFFLFAIGHIDYRAGLDFSMLFYVLLLFALIFFFSSFFFLLKLKKTQPIEYIRLMDKQ